jgi:hypothetical protein
MGFTKTADPSSRLHVKTFGGRLCREWRNKNNIRTRDSPAGCVEFFREKACFPGIVKLSLFGENKAILCEKLYKFFKISELTIYNSCRLAFTNKF